MRLENVQNWPKNEQNWPKNVENQANCPQNIQKVRKLLQNSYSGQKTRDFPLKSYCWSPNLLGTSCLGAATISSSGCTKVLLNNLDYQNFPPFLNNFFFIWQNRVYWLFDRLNLTDRPNSRPFVDKISGQNISHNFCYNFNKKQ